MTSKPNIIPIVLGVLFLSACSQTTNSGSKQFASEISNLPEIEVSEISPGKGNIKIRILGTAQDLFKIRACELGKFAQNKNASHVKTPGQTEVLSEVFTRTQTVSTEHEFEYFRAGSSIPEGSSETPDLLSKCTV